MRAVLFLLLAATLLASSACSSRTSAPHVSVGQTAPRPFAMTPQEVAAKAHLKVLPTELVGMPPVPGSHDLYGVDTYLPKSFGQAPWPQVLAASAAAGLDMSELAGQAVTIHEFRIVGSAHGVGRRLIMIKQWHELVGVYISTDASPSVVTSVGVRLRPPT
jgi:hypothetical protein